MDVCFYSKDPEGAEVDIVEENDYTGIISFPDFKIPPNPKSVKKYLLLSQFSLKSASGMVGEGDIQSNRAT